VPIGCLVRFVRPLPSELTTQMSPHQGPSRSPEMEVSVLKAISSLEAAHVVADAGAKTKPPPRAKHMRSLIVACFIAWRVATQR
jgi:hypothetical protein